jgi:hypothetical protein
MPVIRRCRAACTALVAASLFACASVGGSRSDPLIDVRLQLDRQVAAWNVGDLQAFFDGYVKSDQMRIVAGGKEERGWAPTLARYKSRYTTKASMGTLTYSDLEIHVVDADHAWAYGHWELARGKDRPHGVFTLILVRERKGWRILHDQSD